MNADELMRKVAILESEMTLRNKELADAQREARVHKSGALAYNDMRAKYLNLEAEVRSLRDESDTLRKENNDLKSALRTAQYKLNAARLEQLKRGDDSSSPTSSTPTVAPPLPPATLSKFSESRQPPEETPPPPPMPPPPPVVSNQQTVVPPPPPPPPPPYEPWAGEVYDQRPPGAGMIAKTSGGPEVLFGNSSRISALGFGNVDRTRFDGIDPSLRNVGQHNDDDDAELARLLEMTNAAMRADIRKEQLDAEDDAALEARFRSLMKKK